MNFFNLGAQKLTLYRYTKLYGFISQKTVYQTNQSLQSIKYHRTKWPWFPFKIKMIPLRLMGRWCYNSPIVQFVFIYIHIFLWTLCAHFKIENQTYSRIIICPWIIGCHFNLYAGNIVKASLLNHNMMLSTYILTLNAYILTLIY